MMRVWYSQKQLFGWHLTHDGQRIRKDWKVKDFMTGIDFFDRCGLKIARPIAIIPISTLKATAMCGSNCGPTRLAACRRTIHLGGED